MTSSSSPTSPAIVDLDDHRRPAERRVRLLADAPVRTDAAAAAGRPLDVDVLADIAVGLARAEALWRPHVRHDPLSRTSVRLVATDAYEVWLLGWTDGQHVELHDHGGANAAFVVLEGELEEITLGFAGTTVRRLRAGGAATVAAGTVHDVVNRQPQPATSLHVYADPLRSMTFFEPDGTARHTELVEQVPAILDATSQARALHPAGGGR